MKQVYVDLVSESPYSQSRRHEAPKLDKEGPDDYEVRTWREKCTVNEKNELCIPGMALKQALDSAARLLGRQIPGKGKATYTKHFKAGVLCNDGISLGVKKDEVAFERISVNADGVRGSGKRVWRHFPVIPAWKVTAHFVIFDDTITKDVFEEHMMEAGRFVGIGRFRPQSGGYKGRFKPVAFRWE